MTTIAAVSALFCAALWACAIAFAWCRDFHTPRGILSLGGQPGQDPHRLILQSALSDRETGLRPG